MGFSGDDFFDVELDGGAGAEVAGHEGGIEDGSLVGADPSGVAEAVDFGVDDGVVFLDAFIVAATEDGADGNSALL